MTKNNLSDDIKNKILGLVKQASLYLHFQQIDSDQHLNKECNSLVNTLSDNEVYQVMRFVEVQPRIFSFWSRRKCWKNMSSYLQTKYEQRIGL